MHVGRLALAAALVSGCAAGDAAKSTTPLDGGPLDATFETTSDATEVVDTGSLALDATSEASGDVAFDPDAACATASATATVDVLPVDIVWMVDNSASMAPAVAEVKAGLNAFATLIDSKKLDYRVIMLSIRSKTSPITVAGSLRYPVCIPPPLAGDDNCGNGPRFFQSSVDIKSTQPLEQFLGTLDQTDGYKLGQERGGEPWKDQLRASATKTIVVVTDDNSRFSASDFETFAGGKNPFNSLTLPPGILDPSRKGLFAGYVFAALYGWGSATDPSVRCAYPDGTFPPASGAVYTTLVAKTGGPRAKICDGKAAWSPFFDAIATAVAKTTKLACELALPTPSSGTLDPTAVNVRIGSSGTLLPKVKDAAACGTGPGWYYDDETSPKKVLLCPGSCDVLNATTGDDRGKLEVLFGCKSVIK